MPTTTNLSNTSAPSPITSGDAKHTLQAVANKKGFSRYLIVTTDGKLKQTHFLEVLKEGIKAWWSNRPSLTNERLIQLKALQLVVSLGKTWTRNPEDIALVKALAQRTGLTDDPYLHLQQMTSEFSQSILNTPEASQNAVANFENALTNYNVQYGEGLKAHFSEQVLKTQEKVQETAKRTLPELPKQTEDDDMDDERDAAEESFSDAFTAPDGQGAHSQKEGAFNAEDDSGEAPSPSIHTVNTFPLHNEPSLTHSATPDWIAASEKANKVPPTKTTPPTPPSRVKVITPKIQNKWHLIPKVIKIFTGTAVAIVAAYALYQRGTGPSPVQDQASDPSPTPTAVPSVSSSSSLHSDVTPQLPPTPAPNYIKPLYDTHKWEHLMGRTSGLNDGPLSTPVETGEPAKDTLQKNPTPEPTTAPSTTTKNQNPTNDAPSQPGILTRIGQIFKEKSNYVEHTWYAIGGISAGLGLAQWWTSKPSTRPERNLDIDQDMERQLANDQKFQTGIKVLLDKVTAFRNGALKQDSPNEYDQKWYAILSNPQFQTIIYHLDDISFPHQIQHKVREIFFHIADFQKKVSEVNSPETEDAVYALTLYQECSKTTFQQKYRERALTETPAEEVSHYSTSEVGAIGTTPALGAIHEYLTGNPNWKKQHFAVALAKIKDHIQKSLEDLQDMNLEDLLGKQEEKNQPLCAKLLALTKLLEERDVEKARTAFTNFIEGYRRLLKDPIYTSAPSIPLGKPEKTLRRCIEQISAGIFEMPGLQRLHRRALKEEFYAELEGDLEADRQNIDRAPYSKKMGKLAVEYKKTTANVRFLHKFDPLKGGNIPYLVDEYVFSMPNGRDKNLKILRLATPTIGNEISPEFEAYIASRSDDAPHLYINLQNRLASGLSNERERSQAIWDLHKKYPNKLTVINLDQDSAFYKQAGVESKGNQSVADFKKEFIDNQLLKPNTGFRFPDEDYDHPKDKQVLAAQSRLYDDVCAIYYPGQQEFSRQNRLEFIELYYAHLALQHMKDTTVTSINFSCKDAIDRGGKLLSLVTKLLMIAQGHEMHPANLEKHAVITHAAALFAKTQSIITERANRLMMSLGKMSSHVERARIYLQQGRAALDQLDRRESGGDEDIGWDPTLYALDTASSDDDGNDDADDGGPGPAQPVSAQPGQTRRRPGLSGQGFAGEFPLGAFDPNAGKDQGAKQPSKQEIRKVSKEWTGLAIESPYFNWIIGGTTLKNSVYQNLLCKAIEEGGLKAARVGSRPEISPDLKARILVSFFKFLTSTTNPYIKATAPGNVKVPFSDQLSLLKQQTNKQTFIRYKSEDDRPRLLECEKHTLTKEFQDYLESYAENLETLDVEQMQTLLNEHLSQESLSRIKGYMQEWLKDEEICQKAVDELQRFGKSLQPAISLIEKKLKPKKGT